MTRSTRKHSEIKYIPTTPPPPEETSAIREFNKLKNSFTPVGPSFFAYLFHSCVISPQPSLMSKEQLILGLEGRLCGKRQQKNNELLREKKNGVCCGKLRARFSKPP